MRNVLKNESQLLTSREVQSGRCWSLRYCLFLSCFILSVIFIINFDFYIFSLFLGKFPLALNFSVDILSDIILFFLTFYHIIGKCRRFISRHFYFYLLLFIFCSILRFGYGLRFGKKIVFEF